MDWHVTFYNEKVEDETLSFPKGILANLLHIIEMMLQFGPALGRPYTEAMGEGLFRNSCKRKRRNRSFTFLYTQRQRNCYFTFIYQKNEKNT